MNKAFVREPDVVDENCPRCGSIGQSVPEETLQAFLTLELRRGLAQTASFCPLAACEVVYFDAFGRSVLTNQLPRPVYPKDASAPICACFGLTCADIEQDLAEGGVARTRAAVQRAKTDEARCLTCSPTGRSCVADVQRYYMKHRGAG